MVTVTPALLPQIAVIGHARGSAVQHVGDALLAPRAPLLRRPLVPFARLGHYAAPTGSPAAEGGAAGPGALGPALRGGGGRVQPGDKIGARGGTYKGSFRSPVAGTATAPVVIRQYPGERAVIDGASSD